MHRRVNTCGCEDNIRHDRIAFALLPCPARPVPDTDAGGSPGAPDVSGRTPVADTVRHGVRCRPPL
ncbi:hypothetical protein GCM10009551_052130 [Nocardiopsis tropica]